MSGGNYEYHSDVPFAMQDGHVGDPTTIGEGCWLGTKTVVLNGVSIGRGTVVGAGAVVHQNLPEFVVVTPFQRLVTLPRDQSPK